MGNRRQDGGNFDGTGACADGLASQVECIMPLSESVRVSITAPDRPAGQGLLHGEGRSQQGPNNP